MTEMPEHPKVNLPRFVNSYWWVSFSNATSRFVYGKGEEAAREEAAKHGEVKALRTLPYPATPGDKSPDGCPPFCYSPRQCAGRTCCPKSYACSE